jgi:cytosine/adenosine deaminase-related metal-dependent hydrolase
MSDYGVVVRAPRAVTPAGETAVCIGITGGRIAAVEPLPAELRGGDVVRWMAEKPAQLAGLRRKGRLAVGYDADLCVFAPDEPFRVDADRLQHRNPVTPYEGRRRDGSVPSTWLRGQRIDPATPRGQFLMRGTA